MTSEVSGCSVYRRNKAAPEEQCSIRGADGHQRNMLVRVTGTGLHQRSRLACVEIPWGAQVVVLLSKMKGSGLNCSFYQAIVAGVYGHAYACISMHMHADAYAYAYICTHMHAYACVEIPWGAQVVVLLSKMKGSDLNCRFYQASSLLSSALVLVDSMEHSQKWQCVLLPAGEVSSGLSAKLEGSSLKPSWLAWAKDSKMLAQHFLNSVVASTWAMVP